MPTISFAQLRSLSHDARPSRPMTALLLCLCRQCTALGILLIKKGLCSEKLQYRGKCWLTHLVLTSAKCALTCQLSKQTGGLRLKPAILHDFSSSIQSCDIRDWMHVWFQRSGTLHFGLKLWIKLKSPKTSLKCIQTPWVLRDLQIHFANRIL